MVDSVVAMRVGFVINPLAGIGGAVALKGSDGQETVSQALALGGHSQAQKRSLTALRQIAADSGLTFFTAAGSMGETVLNEAGLSCAVIYQHAAQTTAADTREFILRLLAAEDIDIIVFAGGDGTARDVLDVLSQQGRTAIPVIGIPAGVKIHSAVYATTPSHAGELIALLAAGELMSMIAAEVMDIDEQAFREGRVKAKCYGYLSVPVDDSRMQLSKQGGLNYHEIAVQDIACDVIENMVPDVFYLIGSGSTTAEIMNQLQIPNTLLGVDIVLNQQLVASDVDEKTILSIIDGQPAKMVLTVIGGQGHVFGRGNQQLSASIIRQVGKDNIVLLATSEKLRSLEKRPMIADTGDVLLDQALSGLYAVITGYQQMTLYRMQG